MRESQEGKRRRKIGSNIAVEARKVVIQATFAVPLGVRGKQPERRFRDRSVSVTTICPSNKLTLLSSGVLMTSPADHVYDPLCLCGEGEGWTAPLCLH